MPKSPVTVRKMLRSAGDATYPVPSPDSARARVEEPRRSGLCRTGEGSSGASCCGAHPGRGVAAELGDVLERCLQAMSRDYLQRHFPHAPRVIMQRVQHCGLGGVVPGVQQSSRGPHAQPVRGSRSVTGADPVRWGSPECKNQIVVDRSTVQEGEASGDNCSHSAPSAFLRDALPRRLGPMGGLAHLANHRSQSRHPPRTSGRAQGRRWSVPRPRRPRCLTPGATKSQRWFTAPLNGVAPVSSRTSDAIKRPARYRPSGDEGSTNR